MQNFKIEKYSSISKPILVNIIKINSTFPTFQYAIYYKNPISHDDQQIYKNIKDLKQILIPHNKLSFKLINFQKQNQPVIISSQPFLIKDKFIIIVSRYLDYDIVIEGFLINQTQSQNGLVDLHIIQKKGYDDFYKFRKKYKALESLTKKLQFQIDHRIKMKILCKQYQFDLQDKRKEHYYLNLSDFSSEIQIILQETTSIEDYVDTKKLQEITINMKQLLKQQSNYICLVSFMNKFQIKFLFNIIKNQNFSTNDFVSIRVLQTSKPSKYVKIGTDNTINLNNCLKVQPLINNKFYDYEWGYLNQNLTKIEGNNDIYDYLDKISPSTPKYNNFINQQILDLQNQNNLIFDIDGIKLKIPIVYILKGFNYIQNQKISLKFYIDSSSYDKKQTNFMLNEDKKRIYQLFIQQFLNLNKINKYLDKVNKNQFVIKIINDSLIYFIPFQRKIINKSQFRKQAKQLQIKKEIVIKKQNQYYSLQHHKNVDQVILLSSSALYPFYIIELNSSSSISFQIAIQGNIIYEGSFSKRKIINSEGKSCIHLLSEIEGDKKIGLLVKFTEIEQPYQSAATYYYFKHRLYFIEAGETDQTTYDIQIEFQKDTDAKKLKSKLAPQVKRQSSDIYFLRDFSGDSGLLSKQQTLKFTIKIRKMFYNVDLNYFDNEILQSKSISINPTAQIIKEGKSIMIKLQQQHYKGIQIDLYDTNIKKRMKYYLQIFSKKNEFLDYKDSSYRIKIPNFLWNLNNQNKKQNTQANYELSTHLNRRDNNIDKFNFTNNFLQEIKLNHYKYNDGISLIKNNNIICYIKFINAIKIKCDVLKDKIGWNVNGQWFLTVLALNQQNFYFLMNRLFDPYQDKKNGSDSSRSRKTVSLSKSNRSDLHKIDPLAKTINNLDLFNLKKKRNDLVAQTRQLTARYVKRQQKIIQLNKKLTDLQQSLKKKQQQQKEQKATTKKNKKENVKMKQFYRSICQCGDPYPKYNGYCQNCLKNLKKKYEIYHKEYKEKCYLYEKIIFQKFNKKEKIQNLKKKISNIKNQQIVTDSQDGGAQFFMKNLQQRSLKTLLQDLKLNLFQMQEQKASLISTSNYQMSYLQQKIAKEDDKIYKDSQQYDILKNKLAQIVRLVKK